MCLITEAWEPNDETNVGCSYKGKRNSVPYARFFSQSTIEEIDERDL